MSYMVPDIFPDSYKWLEQQDPNTVREEHYFACVQDYVRFCVQGGEDAAHFMDPAQFFKPGDLQLYQTIQSVWSVVDKGRRCPTLAAMVLQVRVTAGVYTFRESLELQYAQFRAWCHNANLDPDNLNETPKERSNRLAAARMRKMRAKTSEVDITDPAEMELVRAVRAAQDNLKACKKYVREQENAAKTAYDAAVAQAKVARSATVSAAQAWVLPTVQAVHDAEQALESYRINK